MANQGSVMDSTVIPIAIINIENRESQSCQYIDRPQYLFQLEHMQ